MYVAEAGSAQPGQPEALSKMLKGDTSTKTERQAI